MRNTMKLGLLGLAVSALPHSAESKPRDAVVVDAKVQPGADLNEILAANGWTILELPSNMHKPGEMFKPDSSTAEATCIDGTPVTGELPSIEAQGSKGFVVEVGAQAGPVGGSGAVQATSFQSISSLLSLRT